MPQPEWSSRNDVSHIGGGTSCLRELCGAFVQKGKSWGQQVQRSAQSLWQVVWFQHGETGNDRAHKRCPVGSVFMPGAARGGRPMILTHPKLGSWFGIVIFLVVAGGALPSAVVHANTIGPNLGVSFTGSFTGSGGCPFTPTVTLLPQTSIHIGDGRGSSAPSHGFSWYAGI